MKTTKQIRTQQYLVIAAFTLVVVFAFLSGKYFFNL